jgi:hypothetical protein
MGHLVAMEQKTGITLPDPIPRSVGLDATRASVTSPAEGTRRCTAATIKLVKRAGSESFSSREYQDTEGREVAGLSKGCSKECNLCASRVVLPEPACAQISVSLHARPESSRASSRGRSTAPDRGPGTNGFVTISGSARKLCKYLCHLTANGNDCQQIEHNGLSGP